MNEPLQKLIDRTLIQARDDQQRLSNQIEASQDKSHQADRKFRDTCEQLRVLHKEQSEEEKQIAEYRLQLERLQRQIDDVSSHMKAQEDLHENTRKKIKEIRKQSREAEHNRRAARDRKEDLIKKQNKYNAKLQARLEQLLEEHLQACWIELNNCKNLAAGIQALARLHADMDQSEELATPLEELSYWEQNNHPEPDGRIRQKRLAELRHWIEQRYPGALTARSRQKRNTIPSIVEIYYQRHGNTYILPIPVPAEVWNSLCNGAASTEHDTAIQLLWAMLEKLPASSNAEVKIGTSDAVPTLRCTIHGDTAFPDIINIPMTMDFLLSPISPRLEKSRLFK